MSSNFRDVAEQLNEQGLAAEEAERRDDAVKLYEEAAAMDPTWATPLYNLGLLYKYEGSWERSLASNLRAVALDPEDDAAHWNLGIAATALGSWDVARRAWRKFGVAMQDGHDPVDAPCGSSPIRLNPQGDAEVVWAERIDPARAILNNIPYAESGHGWRDIVLNDGAPNGYRIRDGEEFPVFDELQHLQRSAFGTIVSTVVLDDSQQNAERLSELALALGGAAEDWSTSIRMLCKQCSEGRPHANHDQDHKAPERQRTVAIAATSNAHARQIVQAWKRELPGIVVDLGDFALKPGSFS